MEPRSTSPFSARPIILSPPPLGSHEQSQAPMSHPPASSNPQTDAQPSLSAPIPSPAPIPAPAPISASDLGLPQNFQAQRQQSVGYNLQHEFETLNADLDLDLREPHPDSNSGTGAPNSSNTNHVNTFMTASPVPSPANASQAGLGSLLNQNFLPSLSLPNRPQTVTDYSYFKPETSSNFYSELIRYTVWIENLSPQDNLIMIDYLCNNLPVDILMSFKSKLDQHLSGQSQVQSNQGKPLSTAHSDYIPPQNISQNYSNLVSPQYNNPDLVHDLDHLSLAQEDRELQQPKPRQNINAFKSGNVNTATGNNAGSFLGSNSNLNTPNIGHSLLSGATQAPRSRPRSADPNIQKYPINYQYLERSKSPTNHLFEKTNFLQLAAANSPGLLPQTQSQHYVHQHQNQQHQNQHPHYHQQQHYQSPPQSQSQSQSHNSEESLDMSQKLGALATINSRVALDSNKKNYGGYQLSNGGYYHDPTNRSVNSNSVPVGHRSGIKSPNQRLRKNTQSPIHTKDNAGAMSNINNTLGTGNINTPANSSSNSGSSTIASSNNTPGNNTPTLANSSNSSMPADVVNPDLLNNIPAWLKLLRLHKYTDSLKDIPWKQLVELNDEQLEERGVKALGARRKLLKAFDVVKSSN